MKRAGIQKQIAGKPLFNIVPVIACFCLCVTVGCSGQKAPEEDKGGRTPPVENDDFSGWVITPFIPEGKMEDITIGMQEDEVSTLLGSPQCRSSRANGFQHYSTPSNKEVILEKGSLIYFYPGYRIHFGDKRKVVSIIDWRHERGFQNPGTPKDIKKGMTKEQVLRVLGNPRNIWIYSSIMPVLDVSIGKEDRFHEDIPTCNWEYENASIDFNQYGEMIRDKSLPPRFEPERGEGVGEMIKRTERRGY